MLAVTEMIACKIYSNKFISYLSIVSNLSNIVQVQVFQDLYLAAILFVFVLVGCEGFPMNNRWLAVQYGGTLQRFVPNAKRSERWKAGMHFALTR